MDLLGTDTTRVAGAYAAFAGVLAGFVFAVMGYLLGGKGEDNRKRRINVEIALSWAVLAFVGLSLASFLFALLSGEDRFGPPHDGVGPVVTRIRPLALDIVASAVLSIAVLVLLLGLNWLFHVERVGVWFGIQLRAVEWLVGLLTLFYLDGAFLAVPVVQGKLATDDLGPLGLLAAVWITAVTLGEIAGGCLRRLGKKSEGQNPVARGATQSLLLLLFIACASLFNFIDFANESGSDSWGVSDYQWRGVVAFGVVLFLCVLNLPNWTNKNESAESSKATL